MTGRFAPSPSGRMHLGNAFSALLAWLSVRSQKGTMLLRIEDLDPARSKEEYVRLLRDDLHWLGLDWDVESSPQSQRTSRYEAAFHKLEKKELLYPCYCTRAELHSASAPHGSDGQLRYPGTCRSLPASQRPDTRPAWRIKTTREEIAFCDGLQGEYASRIFEDCGDFVVRRADGVYAYQLAVVVDDGEMGVTQVVRGMDLLSSTPRQLYLYEALGLTPPAFYHVPLLTAPDGRRLSKRDGDIDFAYLRERFRPQQVVGLLAYTAGLLPRPIPCTPTELAGDFSWQRVTRDKTCNIYAGLQLLE